MKSYALRQASGFGPAAKSAGGLSRTPSLHSMWGLIA